MGAREEGCARCVEARRGKDVEYWWKEGEERRGDEAVRAVLYTGVTEKVKGPTSKGSLLTEAATSGTELQSGPQR